MKKIVFALIVSVIFGCGGNDNSSSETEKCPQDKPFCHEESDVLWSDRSPQPLSWKDAKKYCSDLKGNFPSVDDLRSLIKKCDNTAPKGKCTASVDCTTSDCLENCKGCEWDDSGKYSSLGDFVVLWSSTEVTDFSDSAYIVEYFNGSVGVTSKSAGAYVRCFVKAKPK